MRTRMAGIFVVLCCSALFAGGCAKKEIVKAEEPVTSAAKPVEAAPPAKPAPNYEVVQEKITTETMPRTDEKAMAAQNGKMTEQVSLDTIYFDFDSYVLSQAARDSLKKNADNLLKKNTAVKIQIEGNCDERGSDEYNLALGEKRAKAALTYLTTLGVPADRLTFISFGKEKPADPGHDEAAWAKNRRDDFTVVK